MRLSYRGVNYEKQTSGIECQEGEVGGKYRGCEWHYHYPRPMPTIETKTSYRKHREIACKSPSLVAKAAVESLPRFCPIDFRKPTAVFTDEIQKIHLENLRRNLERRLQIAKANNNHDLIRLLEKEFSLIQ